MTLPAAAIERARANLLLASLRLAALALSTAYHFWGNIFFRVLARDRNALFVVSQRWTSKWFHSCARILGLEVSVAGNLPVPGSLIAPNHLGYVDIIALGSIRPCFFVAKRDVESWPVVGALFKSSDHVGVPRDASKGLKAANDRVRERLEAGASVCVFLEGTSSGGGSVLPFRTPLLQPAIESGAAVVPVGIRWSTARPDIEIADDVAYWKDHAFVPHVWRLMGLNGIRVHIAFGEPIKTEGSDRRELAAEVREAVLRLLGPA